MIGTSVPPAILQQISDKKTGSEMWKALCDLCEGKKTEATKTYTICRLVNDIWQMNLRHGEDANVYLLRMFDIRTELASLNYTIEDMEMIEMMLESLPYQIDFESLKSSIRYGADLTVYTSSKVRELFHAAAARKSEFRRKRSGKR